MTLSEIIEDLHACEEDLLMYERKYGILSETFYESYMQGDEPPDDAWVLDWVGWAGTYQILQRRRKQYAEQIQALRRQTPYIKHNRILAPGLSFTQPNLPFLIPEIEQTLLA